MNQNRGEVEFPDTEKGFVLSGETSGQCDGRQNRNVATPNRV